ncbi:hypothetical protein C8034_v007956 [Colletotrichum sidae]|uniref:Uncharacterized protein n=3 Tax=Colletotrichum orbiculare species complex TaxID=2707354 RepID=N4V330_COLOR|nr:hypothetical protein Cob_v007576 [Colletotrichum orbiculare MAFF 240422]TDZ38251.1 hypothetical protein C8035_v006783 [Colletotrichum spinosum]TEA10987.1 hypothetical protein C8034_v007956 [Colletotrichum sidae]
MKTSAATIATAFLAAALPALAYPSTLQAREFETWKSQDGGNVAVEVGNNLMAFGSGFPSATLNTILDKCGNIGCTAGQKLNAQTFLVVNNVGVTTNVVLTVEGTFADPGKGGDKVHLVEMAKTTMRTMYSKDVHKFNSSVEYFAKPCRQTKNGCVNMKSDKKTAEQWWATDRITVRYTDDDGDLKSYLNVGFSLPELDTLDGGICGGLASLGGALAAAIGSFAPVAGIPFGLASLACAFSS